MSAGFMPPWVRVSRMGSNESEQNTLNEEAYFINEDEIRPAYMSVTVEEIAREVETTMLRCDGCSHEWSPRVGAPKRCAHCKAKIAYTQSDVGEEMLAAASGDGDSPDESETVAVAEETPDDGGDESMSVEDLLGGGDGE